jgi:hypothetical protein
MYVLWKFRRRRESPSGERVWKLFELMLFTKYAKMEYGYASVDQIRFLRVWSTICQGTSFPTRCHLVSDRLVFGTYTYFLEETLEYLRLLFDESEAGGPRIGPYPLEKWMC